MPNLTIVTVPSHDCSFAALTRARARALFGENGASSAEGPHRLELSLRARYPRVAVRAQDSLASRDPGTVIWYAYRDGTIAASNEADREEARGRRAAHELAGRRGQLADAIEQAHRTIATSRRTWEHSERVAAEYRASKGRVTVTRKD